MELRGANGTPDRRLRIGYRTERGLMLRGSAEQLLNSAMTKKYRRKVQLVFTSPPFPLNHKKRYGNLKGDEYKAWLASFAPISREMLTSDGSIVIELGNAWEPGEPIMSTLALEALLAFRAAGSLHLCKQFVCHN